MLLAELHPCTFVFEKDGSVSPAGHSVLRLSLQGIQLAVAAGMTIIAILSTMHRKICGEQTQLMAKIQHVPCNVLAAPLAIFLQCSKPVPLIVT